MARVNPDPSFSTRRDFLLTVGAGAATLMVGCSGGDDAGKSRTGDPGAGGAGTGGDAAGGQPAAGGAESGGTSGAGGTPTSGGSPGTGGSPANDAGPDGQSVACVPSTPDIEGPFYLPDIPIRTELDLYGETGDRLSLSGVVLDADCLPVPNAIVQIWAANGLGAYDTTSPERRYYGQTATLADGSYRFHTMLPARYLNGSQYRPRHVHMKVWLPQRDAAGNTTLVLVLTTQIYFEGDPYNAIDPWWSASRTVALVDRGAGAFESVFDVRGMALPPAP